MSSRMPRRRLGAAVAAVLAVTLGAGVLTAAPAGALVSARTSSAADPVEVRSLLPGTHLLGGGSAGYFTSVSVGDDDMSKTVRWTPYGPGPSRDMSFRTDVHITDTSGDLLVVSSEGFGATATNLATGESFGPDEVPGTLDLEYRGTAGEALFVLAKAELFMKAQDSGQRRVTGLPEGTRYERVVPAAAGQGLLTYSTAAGERRRGLIDLATASVTETFPYPAGPWGRDAAVSGERFAWVEGDTATNTLRVVVRDRASGAESTVTVPGTAADHGPDIELLGDWLMYDGTARHLRSGETVEVLDHTSTSHTTPDGTAKITEGRSAAHGAGVFRIAPTAEGRPGVQLLAHLGTDASVTHDLDNDGSPDLLGRDSSGTLWRDSPGDGRQAYAIRSGWHIYDKTEVVGNIAGYGHTADVIARDKDGVLWLHQPSGSGFLSRTQIGGGWQTYATITGGSDLTGDGRPDVVAGDKAGTLWLYESTGLTSRPFEARKRIGTGWQIYDQLAAVGELAGGPAGDLVARDREGVLWLYLGKGDGTFTQRTRIGGGWQIYAQLIGAGDVDHDGRADLFATHPGSKTVYVYSGTGDRHRPFRARTLTDIHAGRTYNHMS
ncbi:FG-GAP repeat domain-containing protein [Streptomyces sp. NPDC013457]|uniref:FG-GAP repeat domain-containing protein n=1 Tax=Streptomyces sp. NPDC013457 TaxID=3364866 RepID=UPI0036F88071